MEKLCAKLTFLWVCRPKVTQKTRLIWEPFFERIKYFASLTERGAITVLLGTHLDRLKRHVPWDLVLAPILHR